MLLSLSQKSRTAHHTSLYPTNTSSIQRNHQAPPSPTTHHPTRKEDGITFTLETFHTALEKYDFNSELGIKVKIIGVEPSDANAMALSLHHGQRVILDQVGGFADGVAVKEVGEEPFRICKELVDGVVLVSRDAICASIKDMFEEKMSILEPAGALSLARAEAYCKYYGLKGENVVAITSGANMNFDKLRVVTELANVGRQQEAVLATVLPEEPGSFKRFCELVDVQHVLMC